MKEEQNIANPLLRFASGVFDSLLHILLFLFYLLLLSKIVTLPGLLDSLLNGLILSLFIPTSVPFINSFLISKFGGTLGKLIYGLEIVREENNNKLSFWRAFFRNQIGYSVSGTLFGLGFIWILVDEKKRGWHDLIADTIVLVRNKPLWILGTVLTVALLVINVLLLSATVRNFSANKDLYYGLFEDISKEFQSFDSQNNTPPNLPLDTPENLPVNTI